MTILFDARRPVKPVRPFGLASCPPTTLPHPAGPSNLPGRPPWWAAESGSTPNDDRAPAARPGTTAADRLRALVDRARGLETSLRRERCDAPAGRPRGHRRPAGRLARRLRRLYDAARAAAGSTATTTASPPNRPPWTPWAGPDPPRRRR